MVDLLALVLVYPLIGAVLMLLIGKRLPKAAVNLICCGSVFASFVTGVLAIVQYHSSHEVVLAVWLPLAKADWGLLLDPLSTVMLVVVTGIGFLIHLYSVGYMAHEGGYYRFFGYLNLFIFFMLLLILANNYGLLFVGWEGVGLCSYLLIGFYFRRKSATNAGMKAFLVNRVGDSAFILGMLLTFAAFGTLRFFDVTQAAQKGEGAWALEAIALLFFIGATGKSAQFPLYVWLPDAMEGPTPVSALIHAATMVTAGVYMIARSSAIYFQAPHASSIVAVIGAFTAILAASIALAQNDIKKVLAYSTVSQLGFMFMAAGVGAYWVAIFHLFTHAFFKALLFLGSGSVIHGMNGEQDMRKMGGLRHAMPQTFWTMLIGTLAIAGIPGLAGYFSKEEILKQVFVSPHGSQLIYGVGLITAMMTAFYMWRLMRMTFFGEPRTHVHAHESPLVMTGPLMVLAAGTVMIGWGHKVFAAFLAPVFPAAEEIEVTASFEYALTGVAVLVALVGIYLARYEIRGHIAKILESKWYVDEVYEAVFINGLAKGGGSLLAEFDRRVIDGGVNGAGWLTRMTSRILIFWDTWVVDGAVRLTSALVGFASYPSRLLQTGYVQTYALVVVAGFLILMGVYATR